MDKAKEQTKELINFVQNQDSSWLATTILTITIVVVVISMFSYITNKLRLQKANCDKMISKYTTAPHQTLKSIKDGQKDNVLANFYIKTAYNCCSGGKFKNSYVDVCHLETAIRQGCRVLDFEIYSVDDTPVVATSSVPTIVDNKLNKDSFGFKETYNHIPLETVLGITNRMAFSGDCPNPDDLLFLHFRIKSHNARMYEKMADIITKMSDSLLPQNYGEEQEALELSLMTVNEIKQQGRTIIMVDKSNPMYVSTPLYSYVNISSGSSNMTKHTTFSLLNTADHDQLKIMNKTKLCIVLPDTSENNDNPPINVANLVGCHMVAMNLSKDDGFRGFFDDFFKGSAFVLKPEELRYDPPARGKIDPNAGGPTVGKSCFQTEMGEFCSG